MFYAEIWGRLGADAEERFTSGGKKVINLRMAVNTRRGREEETIWVRVTIWADTFGEDRLSRMLGYWKKGSALIVRGKMQKPEIWTGNDGQAQVSVNMTADTVDFSPFGKGSEQGEGQNSFGNNGSFSGQNQNTSSSSFSSQGGFGSSPQQGGNDPFAGVAQGSGSGASIPEDDLPF